MAIGADVNAHSYENSSQRLAQILADNDSGLLEKLIEMREAAGISQTDLADKLGVTQATVSAFERYDNDPKLSTLRRYALGVGAIIQHVVERDLGDVVGYEGWAPVGVTQITAHRAASSIRSDWGIAS